MFRSLNRGRTWGRAAAAAAAIGLALGLWSCGGTAVSPTPPLAATATPASLPTVPGPTPDPLLDSCELLNSRDVASLFTSAEVGSITHQVGAVDHVIFSTQSVSATEASCVYYVFHLPGSKDMELLQISYWVDVPTQAGGQELAQVWAAARAGAAQSVAGLGDEAFYNDGRLSFKKGGVYVTVEVIGTRLDTGTGAGRSQQLDMETQMAKDILGRLP